MNEILEAAIRETIRDHKSLPFRFQSEHGWHARLIHHLYLMGPAIGTSHDWVQNEARTGSALRRSKEQNWDIAIVDEENNASAVVEMNLKSDSETNTVYDFDKDKKWARSMIWYTSHLLDDLERLYEARDKTEDLHVAEFRESRANVSSKMEQKWHWELIRKASKGAPLFSREEWIQWLADEERQMYERNKASSSTRSVLPIREVLAPEIEKWVANVSVWVSVHRGRSYGAFSLKKDAKRFEMVDL